MIRQIELLAQFHATKYHVPIELFTHAWQVQEWTRNSIAIVLPSSADDAREIAKILTGDLVVLEETPVARLGPNWLVMFMWHLQEQRTDLACKLIDRHIPRLCRAYRHEQRDALIESLGSCVQERRRELQSSIRDDNYELERLSLQVMRLSRKLETDRQVLGLFERSPEWIRGRANRTICDLTKLVPAVYTGFRFDGEAVIGTTHPIDLEYDGCTYHFESFEVEVNLRQGKVFISGGTERNGYVHPHVSDEKSNICWGNIGHLVNRLAGELDLFGLFQLVHQFLNSYNSSDPFQRIEKWDPDWVEDNDDEPYCSWCDDYGHDISDCESCWWCEHCQQYDDHDEDHCPNAPKSEEEEDADAEPAEDTATAG